MRFGAWVLVRLQGAAARRVAAAGPRLRALLRRVGAWALALLEGAAECRWSVLPTIFFLFPGVLLAQKVGHENVFVTCDLPRPAGFSTKARTYFKQEDQATMIVGISFVAVNVYYLFSNATEHRPRCEEPEKRV